MGLHKVQQYRKLHLQMGELFRWWKAPPVASGVSGRTTDERKLIEQTIPANVKVLVSNTTEEFQHPQFGPISTGTMQVSAIPLWSDFVLRFNHLDRFIPLGAGRTHSRYREVTRGSGSTDALLWTPVRSITSVYVGGAVQAASRYVATEAGINWLNNAPAAGTKYTVEYQYYPRYVVLPQTHRTSPTDRNGFSLPLHYWLTLEQNTGDQTY